MLFDGDYELHPLDDLPDAARRLIASVEFEPGQGRKVRKLKLLDRLKVLELIGQSALIVWVYGSTEGLRWEISKLVEGVPPRRTQVKKWLLFTGRD